MIPKEVKFIQIQKLSQYKSQILSKLKPYYWPGLCQLHPKSQNTNPPINPSFKHYLTMSSNLTIEQRLEQLQKAKERAQPQPPKGAKIQRVAHHLRDRKHFTKHYEPKLISLGPIHHGAEKLQLGEQCKQRWAATYIESTGKTPQTLHKRVVDDFENQKKLFDDDLLLASTQQ